MPDIPMPDIPMPDPPPHRDAACKPTSQNHFLNIYSNDFSRHPGLKTTEVVTTAPGYMGCLMPVGPHLTLLGPGLADAIHDHGDDHNGQARLDPSPQIFQRIRQPLNRQQA